MHASLSMDLSYSGTCFTVKNPANEEQNYNTRTKFGDILMPIASVMVIASQVRKN